MKRFRGVWFQPFRGKNCLRSLSPEKISLYIHSLIAAFAASTIFPYVIPFPYRQKYQIIYLHWLENPENSFLLRHSYCFIEISVSQKQLKHHAFQEPKTPFTECQLWMNLSVSTDTMHHRFSTAESSTLCSLNICFYKAINCSFEFPSAFR